MHAHANTCTHVTCSSNWSVSYMRKKIPAVSSLVPSEHENKATMGERLSKHVVSQ